MINSYIVYLDMDGVLADFDLAFKDRFGVDPNDIPEDEKWEKIREYNDTVEDWFLSLEMMPDAGELLKFVTANFSNVQILTAAGTTLKDAPYQKRTWVDDNVGSIRVNVVKKGKEVNVPTPINEQITTLMREIEQGEREFMDRSNLKEIEQFM